MDIHYILWYIVLLILAVAGIFNIYSSYQNIKWLKNIKKQVEDVTKQMKDKYGLK